MLRKVLVMLGWLFVFGFALLQWLMTIGYLRMQSVSSEEAVWQATVGMFTLCLIVRAAWALVVSVNEV